MRKRMTTMYFVLIALHMRKRMTAMYLIAYAEAHDGDYLHRLSGLFLMVNACKADLLNEGQDMHRVQSPPDFDTFLASMRF